MERRKNGPVKVKFKKRLKKWDLKRNGGGEKLEILGDPFWKMIKGNRVRRAEK